MYSAEKLIILDRDGVINQDSDQYIKTLDEWIPYPDAIEAMGRLSQAGWTLCIATNQSGIARGYYSEAILEQMHRRLRDLVKDAGGQITHIAYCPHGPEDSCACRKPLPGLLEQIRDKLGLKSLKGSWMIGDSLRDLEAGARMGCHNVLVRTGKGRCTEQSGWALDRVAVFDDLGSFTDWLLTKHE